MQQETNHNRLWLNEHRLNKHAMKLLLITSSTPLALLIKDVLASLQVHVDAVPTTNQALQKIRQYGAPAITLLLSTGLRDELEGQMALLRNVLFYNPLYVCSPHDISEVCNQSMQLNRQLPYPMAGEQLIDAVTNAFNGSHVSFGAMQQHHSGTSPFLMA